jgi:hypothetical protein
MIMMSNDSARHSEDEEEGEEDGDLEEDGDEGDDGDELSEDSVVSEDSDSERRPKLKRKRFAVADDDEDEAASEPQPMVVKAAKAVPAKPSPVVQITRATKLKANWMLEEDEEEEVSWGRSTVIRTVLISSIVGQKGK